MFKISVVFGGEACRLIQEKPISEDDFCTEFAIKDGLLCQRCLKEITNTLL